MIRPILRNAGIRRGALGRALRGWWRYCRDRRAYRAMDDGVLPWGRELPMLTEWEDEAGSLGAYFHQDLWMARRVREAAPRRHVDVGSRIDGFIGHLAVFREVEVLDIRPVHQEAPGVRFHRVDLMAELPAAWRECTDSLSCLHTLEHFGLGRYGDGIDPRGHERGLARLKEIVEPGGRLYFSTPVGRECVEFNAHRVFAAARLCEWFRDGWEIERGAVLDAAMRLTESAGDGALAGHDGGPGLGMLVARKAGVRADRAGAGSFEGGWE